MNVGQAIINLRKKNRLARKSLLWRLGFRAIFGSREKFNTGNLITAKTEKMISFSRKK